MNKKIVASLLMIVGTFIAAIGQILWKVAMSKQDLFIFFTGYFIYGLFFFIMIYAYKFADMSYVFPHISLNFVWVSLMAFIFLSEPFNLMKLFGVFSIVIGIIFAGLSK